MKNISTILVLCFLMFQTSLFADLEELEIPLGGDRVIRDTQTQTGNLWCPDPGDFTGMTYAQQVAAIDNLNTSAYA